MKVRGSRAEVWHGTAHHTVSGLTKSSFMMHKGRIVSRKKHAAGKKAIKRLFALGYKPKKGTFRLMGRSGSMTRRRRGGYDPSSTNALTNIVQAASTGSPAGGPVMPN